MGAPKVYRWDDSGAPQLAGVAGSLIALLKACLVDGYGSKSAAGWTMPHVSAGLDVAAFRSSPTNGNGFFYRVVDTSAVATGKSSELYGYESMTSETTGLGATPVVYVYKSSSTSSSTYRQWMIIADDQSAYIFIAPALTSIGASDDDICVTFMGDFLSVISGDGYGSGVIGAYTTNTFSYFGSFMSWSSATDSGHFTIRKSSGIGGASGFCGHPGAGPSGNMIGGTGPAHPINGAQTLIARAAINDGAANSFRGYLPGLYYPCHNMPFDNFATVETDYLAMRISAKTTAYTGQVLMDLTTGYRP